MTTKEEVKQEAMIAFDSIFEAIYKKGYIDGKMSVLNSALESMGGIITEALQNPDGRQRYDNKDKN